MVRYQPVYDLTAGIQRRKRRFLVSPHETAVTDHIGGQDCGEATLHEFLPEKEE
jgi:hypothetical protein